MHPKEPQLSEGEKLTRANHSLQKARNPGKAVTKRDKQSDALFERNMGEHAVRTMTVNQAARDYKKDPEQIAEISAESINRMRRGEPSRYNTSKDLTE